MASNPDDIDGVPFTFFASLVREISEIPPQTAGKRKGSSPDPRQVLRRWIACLRHRFPCLPSTTLPTILKFLFPNEDKQRIYDLKHTLLTQRLSSSLGFPPDELKQWQSDSGSGCFGRELQRVLERTHAVRCRNVAKPCILYNSPITTLALGKFGPQLIRQRTQNPIESISPLSIGQVDDILDELAACSPYTDEVIRNKFPRGVRRSRDIILADLFRQLAPADAACAAQIILKDLHPLLYPQIDVHFTKALKEYNSKARVKLDKTAVMFEWDPTGELYAASRVAGILHQTASVYELGNGLTAPRVGTFIKLPESEKGRSCQIALNILRRSNKVYAETKYDGERTQIHVRVDSGKPEITIFSKSTRNSTADRAALHPIVLSALGFGDGDMARIKQDVILDAEMVAYHGDHIDEFWRIRSLIDDTAKGVRGSRRMSSAHKRSIANVDEASQASLASTISDDRQLALVFFDVLYLDSESYLNRPYVDRRTLLETVIKPIPHRAFLSQRTMIDKNSTHSLTSIYHVLAKAISNHEEGLVLKAAESAYNDRSLPWVKLKKDYIPGLGDTLDMVVLGARWDERRGNELNVPTTTFTTFYVGILENSEEIKQSDKVSPLFHIYFTAEYGLSRDQLEEFNFFIKNHNPVDYYKAKPPRHELSYMYKFLVGLPPPKVLLSEPILCEIVGDRFTKAPRSKYYEIRFPRITKYYRPKERTWKDGITPRKLQETAREAVGVDRKDKDIHDYCNDLWGKTSSPGIRSAARRQRRKSDWVNQLRAVDKLPPLEMAIDDPSSPSQSSLSPSVAIKNLFALASADVFEDVSPPQSPLASRTNRPIPSNEGRDKPAPSTPRKSGSSPKRRKVANFLARSDPSMSPRQSLTPTRLPYAMPTPVTSPISSTYPQTSNSHADAMSTFLRESLIWIACPRPIFSGITTGALSAPERHPDIPADNLLHSLDSLFLGCGWPRDSRDASPSICTWAKHGVIFVQDLVSSQQVIQEIYQRKQAIHSLRRHIDTSNVNTGHERKPIWVFDYKILNSQGNDWQRCALCRSD